MDLMIDPQPLFCLREVKILQAPVIIVIFPNLWLYINHFILSLLK